jgi:hypothetical protein
MKSYVLAFAVSLISICLFTTSAVSAQPAASLQVLDATVSRDVIQRAPVDAGDSFPASVGRLFCFTRMVGAQSPTEVTHVWYFGDVERAQVKLSVQAAQWRTWSSKIIQPHEVGQWFVDVIGPGGKVLQTLQFKVTP